MFDIKYFPLSYEQLYSFDTHDISSSLVEKQRNFFQRDVHCLF